MEIVIRFAQWLIIRLMLRYPHFRQFVGHYRHLFSYSFKSVFILMIVLFVTALVFRSYAIYPVLLILCTWVFGSMIVQALKFLESQESNRSLSEFV